MNAWTKLDTLQGSQLDFRICKISFNKILLIIFGIIFVFLLNISLRDQQYTLFKYGYDGGSTEIILTFKDDPQKLMDLNDFKYIINQPPCDENIKALIIIHSAPQNVERRASIRKTWANANLLNGSPLRMLFAFGSVIDKELEKIITDENSKYHDCIQGSFIDSYRNLTYKQAMALKWHTSHCSNADILIKIDDDVYVNTPQLIEYAKPYSNSSIIARNSHRNFNASAVLFTHPKNLIFCVIYDNSVIVRDKNMKWFVTEDEYPGEFYPRYCFGLYVIFSTDVVRRLLEATTNEKYFWIDDVFITGTMAKKINLTHTDAREYVLEKNAYDQLNASQSDLTEQEFLFAWHGVASNDMKYVWDTYLLQLSRKMTYNYLKSKS